jgi:hypothetical protein
VRRIGVGIPLLALVALSGCSSPCEKYVTKLEKCAGRDLQANDRAEFLRACNRDKAARCLAVSCDEITMCMMGMTK